MSVITNVKQASLIDASKIDDWKIKVFGLGSIGSVLVKQLALLGFKDITGYDFDDVHEENIGSQEYYKEHIGMKKTEAIQKLMSDQYDFNVQVVDGKITEETEILPEPNTIYFCGFDSLEARQLLWNKIKSFPVVWGETRIGRTSQRYYFVDLRNKDEAWFKEYEKSLDPSGPRIELKCGEKGCYPSNAELVSKVCRQIVNICENKPHAQMYLGDWGNPASSIIRQPKEEVPMEADYLED
jgi:molybdopterin/thiamine biosynthesis adenylyltransferase